MIDTLNLLAKRVSELDARPTRAELVGWADRDVAHFTLVMSQVTAPGDRELVPPPVHAEEADAIVNRCALVERLRVNVPEIVSGPLLRARQYWISTGGTKATSELEVQHDLSREYFVSPYQFEQVPETKPSTWGLFTSTGSFDTPGMWWVYLQLHRGSTLFPLPWTLWSVEISPDARVAEVTSASEWLRLIGDSPLWKDGLSYPDWRALGRRWDGIHLTASAIAAIQGISFRLGANEVTAPSYWDVETTIWLRWSFAALELEDLDESVGP